ncbi:MAG TPA: aldehyde dehydrogenase family protein [Mycobacteriales bacterium]|nr:aldehyde dehydrogenase family protein [Mycobacteriales bacterium]
MTATVPATEGTAAPTRELVSYEVATGEPLGAVPLSTVDGVAAAVRAAAAAQPDWAAYPGPARAEVLAKAAAILTSRMEELTALIVRESGSIPMKAMVELYGAAAELREAAVLATRAHGTLLPSRDPGREVLARRVPHGVVGVITPWNFPLLLALRSVAPALALGNAVVLKPDPNTPLCGGRVIAEVLAAAGVPEDVFAVVHGDAAVGTALVDAVDMVSFTGSTEVGREVGARAGRALKKVVLELGGQNPFIVLPDVDVERASSAGSWGAFLHAGQICMAARRHLVHADIAEEYVAALGRRADRLRTGDPHRDQVQVGPVINEAQLGKIDAAVRRAVAAGATLVAGGRRDRGSGAGAQQGATLCYRPTVLANVTPDMEIFTTETFGPVATVTVFHTDEEAVALANATAYGLTAGVYTDSVERGRAIADQLRSGVVHIGDQTVNHEPQVPFGGTAASGNGAGFGGEASVEAFTRWLTTTTSTPGRAYPF